MSHKPEKLSQKMKNSKNKLPGIRKNRVQKLKTVQKTHSSRY